MNHLAVIGAGSWGTALAISLSSRFPVVRIWTRSEQRATEISRLRQNERYLPGFALSENTGVSPDLEWVAAEAAVLLLTVPSAHLRSVLNVLSHYVPPRAIIVSATKGIEQGSLLRMSELIGNTLGASASHRLAVLSGPTFAREIAAGEPAAVVIAAHEIAVAENVQRLLSTAVLRFYTSTDVVGVEIGAALKNVIAIGAGLCCGLGLGSNSVAALVTRGLAETTRLAVRLGGHARTLSGLAGLGDLVLTATGTLSRNRSVGIQLGKGYKLDQILAEMTMVAEGVSTCRAAYQLGLTQHIDLPIVNKMYELLYLSKDPREAIRELMDRPLTSE